MYKNRLPSQKWPLFLIKHQERIKHTTKTTKHQKAREINNNYKLYRIRMGNSLGKELHLAVRGQAISPQIPRTQGESTAPSLGKRTEQVGGLGLEIPPSSPSTVSLLWFQAASAPAGISRPTLASRKAASHLWGLGRRQRLTP